MTLAHWATADSPALLTGNLTHTARAWVEMPDGELVELDLIDGTVSWDERRSPRCQASLTCRVPDDYAQAERLDPRTGARLVVHAGYVWPTGVEDVQLLCDLGLRARSISRPDDTMRLDGSGDEAIVIDNAPSAGGTINQATTTAAITYVLQLAIAGLTPTVTASTGAAINQSPIGDKWDAVNDLADRIDAKVYDDGTGDWFIAPTPTSTASPVLSLTVGEGGTITRTDRGLEREAGFFNRVYLRYRWGTGSGEQVVETVQSIGSGPFAATGTNVRTYFEERALPATGAQAIAAATAMVNRTVTRGRSFALSAISAYWVRPGDPIDVTADVSDVHLVSTVSFNLRTGLMDIDTRVAEG